ncbi:Ferritin heavy chain [Tupaia chinensis]|uniref:Ferritin heavy chain n=1 Tax=Tupaia chinensis TaxID=246437 RepID=L9L258_TUPCH|nr:Ferritin heavy chain [Tupaia chinensis]
MTTSTSQVCQNYRQDSEAAVDLAGLPRGRRLTKLQINEVPHLPSGEQEAGPNAWSVRYTWEKRESVTTARVLATDNSDLGCDLTETQRLNEQAKAIEELGDPVTNLSEAGARSPAWRAISEDGEHAERLTKLQINEVPHLPSGEQEAGPNAWSVRYTWEKRESVTTAPARLATDNNDPMCDLTETQRLNEQAKAIEELGDPVTNLSEAGARSPAWRSISDKLALGDSNNES